jgi:hypothetical protein
MLQKIPKCRVAVFLQLASGHALIGTHLTHIGKKEEDACWWYNSSQKQTCSHLFGGCKAWQHEVLDLKKKIEYLWGKRQGRGR